MPYQPGIPTGTVPLNQDYLNIQGNFTSLNTQFNVDHVPLTNTSGTPPNGYHESIHLVPQALITNTTGYGQFYNNTVNDGINTDQIFYFNTGTGNRTIQLTRNVTPSQSGGNGTTFLPGGFLFEFGNATSTSGGSPANLTVSFPTAFPANIFGVQICVLENSNSRRQWHLNTISKTGFTAYIQDSSGSNVADTIYWTAIGN